MLPEPRWAEEPEGSHLADRRPGSAHLRLVGDLQDLPDETLMERYRDGEVAAFDVIVRRHRRPVFSFLRRIVPNNALAEELLADVFLRLHRGARGYVPSARFTTFLYTVAWRTALNAKDKARHQLDTGVGGDADLDARSPAAGPVPLASDPERQVQVLEALASLERELAAIPEGHRAAFILYYHHGQSCAEVADCLGITAAEAKGRLAYARRLLRERLAPMLLPGGRP